MPVPTAAVPFMAGVAVAIAACTRASADVLKSVMLDAVCVCDVAAAPTSDATNVITPVLEFTDLTGASDNTLVDV